ncbi:MAG TPA: hypothetical protein VFM14_16790 [Gemmatimonadales bacterium]|nr:hypothetical protein [Gemmatimonadales bacterium]
MTAVSIPARVRRTFTRLASRIRQERQRRDELRQLRRAGRSIAERTGEVAHLAALTTECERSLGADRVDRAQVDAWVIPVVALRGYATRAVLRHRIARGHRQLQARYEALGRAAAAGTTPPPVPASTDQACRATAGLEAARFGRAFWAQLRPAILPKAPALAGLAVGWWIANTYTDSRWKSLARSVGIGSGGTQVVSAETYRAMSFWLPLLAAAACAYLGDRLAAAWRSR